MKKCSRCGELKPLTEFHNVKRRGRIEHHYYCKTCHAENHRINYCDKMSDKYIERALKEQGFTQITNELIQVKRNLLILKRTIWQSSRM